MKNKKERKTMLKIEQIDNNHQRLKVFGGWLVKAYTPVVHMMPDQGFQEGWDWRIAMAFVPDPKHEWKIKKSNHENKKEK